MLPRIKKFFLRPAAEISTRSPKPARRPVLETLEQRRLLSGINPAIIADTVPSQILVGAKLHSAISLTLTNSLPTTETGYTVNIYASTTPTLDTTVDPLVTSVSRPASRIGPLKTVPLKVNVTSLPSTLATNTPYYLIAETVDATGNTGSIATNTTINLAPANISFTETVASTFPPQLVSGTKIKGSVKVGLINGGNIPAKGTTTINLTASTTPGVVGTSIVSVQKKVNIGIGRTGFVTVPISTLPVLPDGTYFIVAQVTDPNGAVTLATSTSVTISAPHISLSGTIGTIAKVQSGATVYVTNNGNVADVTVLRGTFGLSTDPAGTVPAGSTVTLSSPKLNIKPQKTVSFHIKPSKAFLSGLTPGVAYYLTVTFVDASGNIGTAVSPNSFTV